MAAVSEVLAAAALTIALLVLAAPAAAQFVCGGSLNGGEPQSGAGASAAPADAVACGPGGSAGGSGSTASGANAQANGANAIAIGGNTGATTTRASQQMFGRANNTYTMPGITSAASRAAQSGPAQIVTADASGNLATSTLAGLGIASPSDIATINSQLAALNNQVGDLYGRSSRACSGVAMAGVPTLLPTEKFAATLNYGTFLGQSGLAVNAAARLSESLQLTGGIGYGVNEKIAGGRVGLRMGW